MRRRGRASRGALLCRRGERTAAISASVAPSAIAATLASSITAPSLSTASISASISPSAISASVPSSVSTAAAASSSLPAQLCPALLGARLGVRQHVRRVRQLLGGDGRLPAQRDMAAGACAVRAVRRSAVHAG